MRTVCWGVFGVLLGIFALVVVAHNTIASSPQQMATSAIAILVFPPTIAPYVATPGLMPTPSRSTDLAPDVPKMDKGTLIVRHADGTYEQYLVTKETVKLVLQQLVPEDRIAAGAPPQSLMGHFPPPPPSSIADDTLPTPNMPTTTP